MLSVSLLAVNVERVNEVEKKMVRCDCNRAGDGGDDWSCERFK